MSPSTFWLPIPTRPYASCLCTPHYCPESLASQGSYSALGDPRGASCISWAAGLGAKPCLPFLEPYLYPLNLELTPTPTPTESRCRLWLGAMPALASAACGVSWHQFPPLKWM